MRDGDAKRQRRALAPTQQQAPGTSDAVLGYMQEVLMATREIKTAVQEAKADVQEVKTEVQEAKTQVRDIKAEAEQRANAVTNMITTLQESVNSMEIDIETLSEYLETTAAKAKDSFQAIFDLQADVTMLRSKVTSLETTSLPKLQKDIQHKIEAAVDKDTMVVR